MSENRLPGLSSLTEAQLREQYAKELGQPVPDDLTTTDKLRAAIKAHREAAPKAPEASKEAAVPQGHVRATQGTETRDFPQRTWDLLGADKAGWVAKAPKPSELQ